MEKDIFETIYTADDEEPNCGRCDNINAPHTFCNGNCGAEHFWEGYKRTEKEEFDRKEK